MRPAHRKKLLACTSYDSRNQALRRVAEKVQAHLHIEDGGCLGCVHVLSAQQTGHAMGWFGFRASRSAA
jgi:hypothetical protein